MLIWLDKNKDERCLKEKEDKFCIGKERRGNNLLFGLVLRLSDLNVEALVVGKPKFLKNFCTGGERSTLKNIGTISIAIQLHWSNGYYISSSSSDDG
jgi:hypothetical protein